MKPNIKLGYYKHFKGTVYRAFSLAQDSETLQWRSQALPEVASGKLLLRAVVYGNAHGDWVRAAESFAEQVEHDGKTLPRFEFLEEAIH